MKNECDVIKDLLPSYDAKLLSIKTNEAVEEHLNNCEECKIILKKMNMKCQNDINKQQEIDYLKKYKRKMNIFKSVLLIIILIIVFFISMIIMRYNNTINIMKSVKNNIDEIQEKDNYTISIIEHRIDYQTKRDSTFVTTHYYKDSKYRTENNCININFDLINKNTSYYGEIDSNRRIQIVKDTKTVYKESRNYAYTKRESFLKDLKNEIEIFNADFGLFNNLFMKIGYGVREDQYNGKECFVIKSENNEGYGEFWIEKDSMMMIRRICENYNSSYTEKIYNISIDTVKDEDLIIPNLDMYKIENINNNVKDEYLDLYKNQ